MASSSCLLRAAVGFVAGSTVGYFGYESIHKSAHGRLKNLKDSPDEEYWTLPTLPSAAAIKPWDDNWDRRDPKILAKHKRKSHNSDGAKADNNNNQLAVEDEIQKFTPKATRHLLLIRHGQYATDAPTDETRILTPLGLDQGDMTGRRLLEMNLPYTKLIQSSMTRARETSAAIQKHLPSVPVIECDLLREGAPWPPEPPLSSWRPEHKQLYQDSARIEAAFRKYFHRADYKQQEDSYEVIVCHANVIRYFVCRALQLPPEAWLRLSLFHGSITWVMIRPSGRVTLRALGDSGYMPFNKVTVYN